MKKQHILSAVILIVVAALVGFKVYSVYHPKAVQTATVTPVPGTVGEVQSTTVSETTTSSIKPAVKVTTETPINGQYKGVIEVGASGFNAFVVNIDKDKNWQLVSKEFGASLAYEGFATTDDVYSQLKKYIANIADKGVKGNNIHFVISSGALKNPKIDLVADAIQKKGFVVNRVTADQEGKYALKALLPKQYKDKSFTVDIGSGNTKINWYTGDKMNTVECSGAKYYEINKTDQEVYNEIKEAIAKVPAANRQFCFMIGGVPFKLAQETRSGEERFTQLKNPDEYSGGDDVKKKSGLNIYRAIYENSNCDSFIFDWDANFTIGFLMTIN